MLTPSTIELIGTLDTVGDRFKEALRHLEAGDIAVDCGANVGDISKRLASRGCLVHAFEPDPIALERLKKRLGNDNRVVIHEAAVGVEAGKARLFFHRKREADAATIEITQASSVVADKRNISTENYVEVDVIDFPSFLTALPKKVSILKIDVEGAEAVLLEALLQKGLTNRFEIAFIETHEMKVPSTRPIMQRVRDEIAHQNLKHIFLDWL